MKGDMLFGREQRLKQSLYLVTDTLMEVMSLNSCDYIKTGVICDVVSFASFEYVERLVKTERGMRKQRRNYKKLVETLGE